MTYKIILLLVGTVFISSLAGGCSSPARGAKYERAGKGAKPAQEVLKIDEFKLKEFASRGYDSGIEYVIEESKLSLSFENISTQVSIVQPRRKGKYPLVIYMPGLGESNDAAKGIRTSWATSGFVVLTIQPLKDDELILSSVAALEGDFAYIRHERYSSEVVSSRIAVLTKLIEYLKQGGLSGDSRVNNIDLEHIAIVGFDIGANSAMIVAGERMQDIVRDGLPLKVSGVIALSPFADFSGSTFSARYQDINLPVLSITGDEDDDTHGVVPITLHQAPFQYMPNGNKYLLLLAGASHAVIGNGVQTAVAKNDADSGKKTDSDSSDKASGKRRGGGRNGKKASGNDSENPVTPAIVKRAPAGSTQRAMMEVAIEQVSTAFLNAYVKNDKAATDWLINNAKPWLYGLGQLKEK